MIQHKSTADRLGVTLDDADHLLLKGLATAKVCGRLGLSPADIDEFIRSGFVSANLANRLGLQPLAAVDELAKVLGRDGRIGLLVGFLLNI